MRKHETARTTASTRSKGKLGTGGASLGKKALSVFMSVVLVMGLNPGLAMADIQAGAPDPGALSAQNGDGDTGNPPASSATPTIVDAGAPVWAPLVDKAAEPLSDLIVDGAVTPTKGENNIYTVAFRGSALKKHTAGNASGPVGYWQGVGVPQNATQGVTTKYAVGRNLDDLENLASLPYKAQDEEGYPRDDTYTVGISTYDTFYFNAATNKNGYVVAQYKPAETEGADPTVTYAVYKLDFSAVSLDFSTATLAIDGTFKAGANQAAAIASAATVSFDGATAEPAKYDLKFYADDKCETQIDKVASPGTYYARAEAKDDSGYAGNSNVVAVALTLDDPVFAPLHDNDTSESALADEDLISGEAVEKSVNTEGNTITVTYSGSDLRKHMAANMLDAYWLGVGIPQVEDATYASGWYSDNLNVLDEDYGPAADKRTSYFTDETTGVTYDTFYFGSYTKAPGKAYVAVKYATGTKVMYVLDFTSVTASLADATFSLNQSTFYTVDGATDLTSNVANAAKVEQTIAEGSAPVAAENYDVEIYSDENCTSAVASVMAPGTYYARAEATGSVYSGTTNVTMFTVASLAPIWAPLKDDAEKIPDADLVKSGKITTTATEGGADVVYTGNALRRHTHEQTTGDWLGVGIPRLGSGATYAAGYNNSFTEESYGPISNLVVGEYKPEGSDITYDTFYFNYDPATENGKVGYVSVKPFEGAAAITYKLDFSKVTLSLLDAVLGVQPTPEEPFVVSGDNDVLKNIKDVASVTLNAKDVKSQCVIRVYSDQECKNEVSSITEGGTYYVKAVNSGAGSYVYGSTNAVSVQVKDDLTNASIKSKSDNDGIYAYTGDDLKETISNDTQVGYLEEFDFNEIDSSNYELAFYSDLNCQHRVETVTNPGIYYVVATAASNSAYSGFTSSTVFVAPADPTFAPLEDHPAGDTAPIDKDTLIEKGEVSVTSDYLADEVAVTYTGANLKKHHNDSSEHTEAFWLGVGIQQIPGATYTGGWLGEGASPLTPDASYKASDVTYDTFYFGGSTGAPENAFVTATFKYDNDLPESDKDTYTITYTLDFSQVTVEGKTSIADATLAVPGQVAYQGVDLAGAIAQDEATALTQNGTAVEKSNYSLLFYTDEACTTAVTSVITPGTYYVKARANNNSTYTGSTSAAAKVEVVIPQPVLAPLVDDPASGGRDKLTGDLIKDASLTLPDGSDTYYESFLGGYDLMRHANGQHTEGYWLGVGIPQMGENAKYAAYWEGGSGEDKPVAEVRDNVYTPEGSNITYDTFYFGYNPAEGKKVGYIRVTPTTSATPVIYKFDFSRVNLALSQGAVSLESTSFTYEGSDLADAVKNAASVAIDGTLVAPEQYILKIFSDAQCQNEVTAVDSAGTYYIEALGNGSVSNSAEGYYFSGSTPPTSFTVKESLAQHEVGINGADGFYYNGEDLYNAVKTAASVKVGDSTLSDNDIEIAIFSDEACEKAVSAITNPGMYYVKATAKADSATYVGATPATALNVKAGQATFAPLEDHATVNPTPKDELISGEGVNNSFQDATVTVAFSGKDLVKHTNLAPTPTEAYWLGAGIPQVEGAKYAVGWYKDYNKGTLTFNASPDNYYTEGGTTYDTFYFGGQEGTPEKGFVAVQYDYANADGVTPKDTYVVTYILDFSAVTVAGKTDIAEAQVTVDGEYTFTGTDQATAIAAATKVMLGETDITDQVDLVFYDKDGNEVTKITNAGDYTVKAKAKASSNYTGQSEAASFSVAKAASTFALNDSADATFSLTTEGTTNTKDVVVKDNIGSVTASSSNEEAATATVSGTTVTVTAVKESAEPVVITITDPGDDNHEGGSITVSVSVAVLADNGVTAVPELDEAKAETATSLELEVTPMTQVPATEPAKETVDAQVESYKEDTKIDNDSIKIFEVTLTMTKTDGETEELSENFGSVTLNFPVDPKYNGRLAYVSNVHGTEAEGFAPINQTVPVRNGFVPVKVNKLSHFIIAVQNSFNVTFDGNGATGGSMAAATTDADGKFEVPACSFTKTGHSFTGWKDAAGTDYNAGAEVTLTEDTTLIAQWAANTYAITFNANGGAGSMSAITAKYGQTVTLTANKFTRANYTFAGWATSAKGGVVYKNGASVKVDGNKTLYAVWTMAGKQMHRLYNPYSGEHFYTADTHERNVLVSLGWNSEGVGWVAPTSGKDVYRLYNRFSGDHHFTLDAHEKDVLVSLGWTYEGVGWKSGGNVKVFREYNPYAPAFYHNYTKDIVEHNTLCSIGWRNEGVGWYGIG